MSISASESTTREIANYGGFVDAFGGAATVVLAIVALAGTTPDILLGIATIVFGVALLVQSGTVLTEMSAAQSGAQQSFSGGLSMVFLGGAAGIVLGVLALLGIHAVLLTAIAAIVFGSALVFGSSSLITVFRARHSSQFRGGAGAATAAELIANEIAAGSAGLQWLGGFAAIVLGILAVTGTFPAVLSLIALLVMGATVLLAGATLTNVAQSFMHASEPWSRSPAP